tara:strand:- start:1820 stop:2185 length:366 start_codon:yes stop_codon:yes gene_type:complete
MKTTPYSIHIDEDVAVYLDRHKKVAGRSDSHGKYVSRCIRAYEKLIDETQAIKEELRGMEQAINDMRTLARKAYIAKNRFMRMFQMALKGDEIKDTVSPSAEWMMADREMTEDIYGPEVIE